MLKPGYTKRFEKDLKRILKRGKDKELLKMIINKLIMEEKPETRYRDYNIG
jgi:mRNA interferase YafQ